MQRRAILLGTAFLFLPRVTPSFSQAASKIDDPEIYVQIVKFMIKVKESLEPWATAIDKIKFRNTVQAMNNVLFDLLQAKSDILFDLKTSDCSEQSLSAARKAETTLRESLDRLRIVSKKLADSNAPGELRKPANEIGNLGLKIKIGKEWIILINQFCKKPAVDKEAILSMIRASISHVRDAQNATADLLQKLDN
ncbi:hypothetical protein [Rhizobium laguerreae]|uniref:hypothetical protein n=1 Tax=Rhizobium laguerreae TaxID=1076926 RepID=UPI001C8FCEEF|nr:hypothetical protein [Rhizobium laguerreae]MBY3386554.1 hypothetical protein [Rhizobium laguerreae]MBY3400637.1 hypothetical protein [Rhizobium laguerreae]MBY3407575.1 hypothetical protein [Rhizobium laguerreae]